MPESASFSQRYERLDEANKESWYMNEADRPFSVFMSVHSAGKPREVPGKEATDEEIDEIRQHNRAARSLAEFATGMFTRVELAGNASTVRRADGVVPYGRYELTDQERYDDGLANMIRFFNTEGIDVDIRNVRVLNPERRYDTPLTIVNVDEDPGAYEGGAPVLLETSGDFLYSYNPNIVFRAGPADCPIAVITAETPKGSIYMLVHFAWRGPVAGQFDDMERAFDDLGVERGTMRVYITPGGQAETYGYDDYLPDGTLNPEPVESDVLVNVQEFIGEDEKTHYSFGIDTPHAVYKAFMNLGLTPYQVFIDTSDTTSQVSGHSSHSRSSRRYGAKGKNADDNTRDTMVAKFNPLTSN